VQERLRKGRWGPGMCSCALNSSAAAVVRSGSSRVRDAILQHLYGPSMAPCFPLNFLHGRRKCSRLRICAPPKPSNHVSEPHPTLSQKRPPSLTSLSRRQWNGRFSRALCPLSYLFNAPGVPSHQYQSTATGARLWLSNVPAAAAAWSSELAARRVPTRAQLGPA